MAHSPLQFSFALPTTTAYRQEDFALSASNRSAYEQVMETAWTQPVMVLQGPPASGKTHLARIWAQRHQARCMEAGQLDGAAAQAIISAGEAATYWVVENLPQLADEVALFHLVNAVREQGGSVLLTSNTAPSHLDTALADLRSRLCAAPLAALDAPDDAALMAAIHKQFADRQLRVGEEAIRYLLMRMNRSFAAARHWVERIDAASLAAQRKVTTALIRELLEEERKSHEPPLL